MKVLVLNNAVPFIRGGAEELATNLVGNLNRTKGVEAELMRIPFNWVPKERLLDEILLNRMLQIINVDRVIALKFPAYLVPHANKTVWLLHQFRQAYDLKEAGQSYFGDDPESAVLLNAIRKADAAAFHASQRIFTNSTVTQARLKKFNGISSEVLLPPLNDEELFTGGRYEPYIFAGGRVSAGKRQHLLIEAMRHVKSPVKLVVAGPPETEDYENQLKVLVARYGLEDKVVLKMGFLPREEIASLVNDALACAYCPFDEDSLGYVSMEAAAAKKAVLTLRDSGGILHLVRDGETGLVADPDPEDMGRKLENLAGDQARTRKMGANAGVAWAKLGLTWPNTIAKLLG